MSQTRTPARAVRIGDPLLNAARTGLGLPESVPLSDVIRAALAKVGGVELSEHTPKNPGRPLLENPTWPRRARKDTAA